MLALVALPACGTARQHGTPRPATRPASGVALKRIGSFDAPTYVAGAPGFPRLLFVVEQPGTVRVIRDGHELGRPFLDIRSLVGDDGGERDRDQAGPLPRPGRERALRDGDGSKSVRAGPRRRLRDHPTRR